MRVCMCAIYMWCVMCGACMCVCVCYIYLVCDVWCVHVCAVCECKKENVITCYLTSSGYDWSRETLPFLSVLLSFLTHYNKHLLY